MILQEPSWVRSSKKQIVINTCFIYISHKNFKFQRHPVTATFIWYITQKVYKGAIYVRTFAKGMDAAFWIKV